MNDGRRRGGCYRSKDVVYCCSTALAADGIQNAENCYKFKSISYVELVVPSPRSVFLLIHYSECVVPDWQRENISMAIHLGTLLTIFWSPLFPIQQYHLIISTA